MLVTIGIKCFNQEATIGAAIEAARAPVFVASSGGIKIDGARRNLSA